AEVFAADARALAYGRSASEVLDNPQLRDKVRALFGADWGPPSPGVGKLTLAAPAYFERGGPVRMVRVGDANYIAITGCAAQAACTGHRGLLLVREGGEQLMARLDEGGFSHHYAHGTQVAGASTILDSALRALERASEGSAFPRPGP
ncbi:MAG: hypothetical protein ACRELW_20770, partial [Candidatus Rokuibacteriota bacterium]